MTAAVQVAVMGAGIAGTAAALALSAAGVPVLLAGHTTPGRHTAATLSPGAVRVLELLGVDTAADDLAAVPDAENPGGLHVHAGRVSAALRRRLADADVIRVVGTAELARLDPGGTRVDVHTADGTEQWDAGTVVVATGTADDGLGSVSTPSRTAPPETVLRFLVHSPHQGVRAATGTADGGTCWVVPVDADHVEVGRSWPGGARPGPVADPAALLEGTGLSGTVLGSARTRTTSSWQRRRPSSAAGPGWFAVGMAAGLVESPAADPLGRILLATGDLPEATAAASGGPAAAAGAARSWDSATSDLLRALERLDALLHTEVTGDDGVVTRSRDLLALVTDPTCRGPLLRAREAEEGRRPIHPIDPWGPMSRLLG